MRTFNKDALNIVREMMYGFEINCVLPGSTLEEDCVERYGKSNLHILPIAMKVEHTLNFPVVMIAQIGYVGYIKLIDGEITNYFPHCTHGGPDGASDDEIIALAKQKLQF